VLRNACEASPPGSVVQVRALRETLGADSPAGLPAGDYVSIRITDQGSGVAPENLTRVFDPYFSTKPLGSQKGMGLGLALCHAVLQQHGGAVTLAAGHPQGTSVVFYLRVGTAAAIPARPAAQPDGR